jgi:hypothetical protein
MNFKNLEYTVLSTIDATQSKTKDDHLHYKTTKGQIPEPQYKTKNQKLIKKLWAIIIMNSTLIFLYLFINIIFNM